MAQTYQIISLSDDELDTIIQNSVSKALQGWSPSMPDPILPQYVTRKEVAGLLRISLPTVDDYIRRGIIKAARLGNGRIRISRAELENVMTEVKSLRYKRK